MYNLSELYIFIVASFFLAISPGPAVVYIVIQTTTIGKRAGFLSAIGVGLGDFVQVLIVGFGLSQVLQTSEMAVQTLKIFGFIYLCFLAIKALKNGKLDFNKPIESKEKKDSELFWEGFWVQVINPKTALFFIAFLPQFTNPMKGNIDLQIIFLGGVFVFSCFVSDCFYIFFSAKIKEKLFQKQASNGFLTYIRSAVYFVLGLMILVEN